MIKFDKKAMQKFNQIPDDVKSKLLSNVYCSKCKTTVKIVDFEATIENNDLILKGQCKKCSGSVTRVIRG